MVRLIALIISIILQIIAASIALGFMKLTKYRLSWITSLALFCIHDCAFDNSAFWIFQGNAFLYMEDDRWMDRRSCFSYDNWWCILIRELFYSLKRAETDRIRSEKKSNKCYNKHWGKWEKEVCKRSSRRSRTDSFNRKKCLYLRWWQNQRSTGSVITF